MASKMVTRQQAASDAIGTAALKNADVLAAKLTESLAAHSHQAEPPQMDWKSILEDVGQFLVDSGKSLVERDHELLIQRRIQLQLRFQRDESVDLIRTQLRGMRFLIDEAFGKEKARLLFPARADLQRVDARTLLQVAREAVTLLQGSGFTWPDLTHLGHAATPAQLVAILEQTIPRLAMAVEGLDPEKSGANHALGNKTREIDATLEAMQRGADLLFGLFRFVGFDVEAERLRPRRRKARGPAEPDEPMTPAPLPAVPPPKVGFPPPVAAC